jgi:glucosamine-6-phosphate deaminase
MRLVLMSNYQQLSFAAAKIVTELVARKPTATIALPTGSTPLGMYRMLAELKKTDKFSCSKARFFNLDEFCGKSPDDPQSYAAFLWKHFFGPLDVDPSRVRLLRGDAPDPRAECAEFEESIVKAGGLDLAVLGLGRNGHIAFNEPSSDWMAGTRQVKLTQATRQAQSRLFTKAEDIPDKGLTMGIPTILSARAILLLVSGRGKQAAVEALLRGTPDPDRSVTAILGHPELDILVDGAMRTVEDKHQDFAF